MKRQTLLRAISEASKAAEVSWQLLRQGAKHELWRCGTITVTIPRHRDVNEYTAEAIMKDLASQLGEDWWK